ncbi:hypothetical protein GPECTOR_2g1462 [Gonium pectorale]|uniref:Uncharacterized protein n=1 Tax=Gonium pectorale TaxID=33097 RepID=A0A150H1E3_GONPE|nr:hypothetical protein GPECTOR_2g1462 [Gonium pectorale]|eukprot:KXZ55911.1 hypothetical protein GPECTOR_2g1462 [Gonium pectorale]
MRSAPTLVHLRLVHDERHGAPPQGLTEARAVELTETIRLAASLPQLADVLDAHGDALNGINLTAAAARLAQLAAPADTGASGGRGGWDGEGPEAEVDLGEALGDAAAAAAGGVAAEEAAEEAAEAALLASLGALLGEAGDDGTAAESARRTQLGGGGVGAVLRRGTLSPAPVQSWSTAAAATRGGGGRATLTPTPATAAEERALVDRLAELLGDLVQRRILDLDPEGVVTLLYAYGKIQRRHDVLPDLVYVAGQHMDIYHAKDKVSAWLEEAVLPELAGRLPSLDVRQLATVLYGLGVLHHRPGRPAWMHAFWAAVGERLAEADPQALSSVAWSLRQLGIRPGAPWRAAFLEAARGALPACSPSELAVLLYGTASFTQAHEQDKGRDGGVRGGLAVEPACPDREWLTRAEAEWLQCMDRCGPVELYRGLCALAAWRYCPGPQWQAALLRQLGARLGELPAWQLSHVVRLLADVGCRPPLPLLNGLVAGAVTRTTPAAADLARLAYGLARMGRQLEQGSAVGY